MALSPEDKAEIVEIVKGLLPVMPQIPAHLLPPPPEVPVTTEEEKELLHFARHHIFPAHEKYTLRGQELTCENARKQLVCMSLPRARDIVRQIKAAQKAEPKSKDAK